MWDDAEAENNRCSVRVNTPHRLGLLGFYVVQKRVSHKKVPPRQRLVTESVYTYSRKLYELFSQKGPGCDILHYRTATILPERSSKMTNNGPLHTVGAHFVPR